MDLSRSIENHHYYLSNQGSIHLHQMLDWVELLQIVRHTKYTLYLYGKYFLILNTIFHYLHRRLKRFVQSKF